MGKDYKFRIANYERGQRGLMKQDTEIITYGGIGKRESNSMWREPNGHM